MNVIQAYHGSPGKIEGPLEIRPGMGAGLPNEQAIWATDDPDDADYFGAVAIDVDGFPVVRYTDYSGDDGPLYDPEVMEALLADVGAGPGVVIIDLQLLEYSEPGTSYAVFDPRRILSVETARRVRPPE